MMCAELLKDNGNDQTHIRRILYIIIGLILLGFAFVGYKYYFPPPPPNPARVDSITVDKPLYHRGEVVIYTVYGEKFISMPANVVISLINGESYYIMSYTGNLPVGPMHHSREFIVPQHIKPGLYKLNWTSSYHFEGRVDVHRNILSDHFEVMASIQEGVIQGLRRDVDSQIQRNKRIDATRGKK